MCPLPSSVNKEHKPFIVEQSKQASTLMAGSSESLLANSSTARELKNSKTDFLGKITDKEPKIEEQPLAVISADKVSSVAIAPAKPAYRIKTKPGKPERGSSKEPNKLSHTSEQEMGGPNQTRKPIQLLTAHRKAIESQNKVAASQNIKSVSSTLKLEPTAVLLKELNGKAFIAEDGSRVTLHNVAGKWLASWQSQWAVECSTIHKLPVYIGPGMKLLELLEMNEAWQKRYIQVGYKKNQLAKECTPIGVYIGQRGMLGGGFPLHTATEANSLEEVKRLILAGSAIDLPDRAGNTPLHIAVKEGFIDIAQELLVANASLQVTNKAGETPLSEAVKTGNQTIIALFKDYVDRESNDTLDTVLPIEEHTIPKWIACIYAEILKQKLTPLFRGPIESIVKRMLPLLQRAGFYDAFKETINALLQKGTAYTDADALQLKEALDLLVEYGVLEIESLQKALNIIQNTDPQNWVKEVHALVIATTFVISTERTVEEIIDCIVAKSAYASFANHKATLQKAYKDLLDAYHSSSTLSTDNKKFISSWAEEDIQTWATVIKEKPSIDFTQAAVKYELIAVVQRAVELYHNYTPRATQLLSILILLNPAQEKGRFAQINTGEGKSLIVAMLAAIHALQGKKVDVVTTSTELSVPEVAEQEGFFNMLGLSVGENSKYEAKREAYKCNIVYGTAGDFQGDILRTEFSGLDIRGERGAGVVIVDEVDSMLFDNRSYSIRLASKTPAMNHLEVLLAAAWNQAKTVFTKLVTARNGKIYFMQEDFDVIDEEIIPISQKPLEECSIEIEDVEGFIKDCIQQHLETLLRELSEQEKKEFDAYRAEQLAIDKLTQAISAEQDDAERQKKIECFKQRRQALQNMDWEKRHPIVEIPNHLKDYTKKQIPHWSNSALQALCFYKKEFHYDVKDGEIIPIDYENTGVLQNNTVWSNGLAQMLQIKEGLRVESEDISTSFISTVGFFRRYGKELYGLTGTLGNQTTQDFFSEVYNADLVTIPPYKQMQVAGNKESLYSCKELPAIIVHTPEMWYKEVIRAVVNKASNRQAALVICKYINQVDKLADELRKVYIADKIFTYTGREEFSKKIIDAGEIIIATNIAGRGTDIITSKEVEDQGGMHVCITFLPDNYRVELQNAGRTARQGKRGSAQLILYCQDPTSIQELRNKRDIKEQAAIEQAKREVDNMLFKDNLFNRFCGLEDELLPSASSCEKEEQSARLNRMWQEYIEKIFDPTYIETLYKQKIEDLVKKRVDEYMAKLPSDLTTEALKNSRTNAEQLYRERVQKQVTRENYTEMHKKYHLRAFCDQHKEDISADVVECFRAGKTFIVKSHDLARQKNWGRYERKGLEDRWGIWLHHAVEGANTKSEQATLKEFENFSEDIQKDAKNDCLIQNPYFYVLKGNALIDKKHYGDAISMYNRAIQLDPLHSVNAQYNKALAILSCKDNKPADYRRARDALDAANELIVTRHRFNLLLFHSLVNAVDTKHIKKELSEHVEHQIDILAAQEAHIEAAVKVIESALGKEWEVEVVEKNPLENVFAGSEKNHAPAIKKAEVNGLTHLFIVTEKKPIPWGTVMAIALIGIAEIAVGCVLCYFTGGQYGIGFIKEGISDLITAANVIKNREFSWEDWAAQKVSSFAISIGVSCLETIAQVAEKALGLIEKIPVIKDLINPNMDIMKEQLALAFSQGIGKELLTLTGSAAVSKTILQGEEEKIAKEVTKEIKDFLDNHKLIEDALALDINQHSNEWFSIFKQEGLGILSRKKDLHDKILKNISKGIKSGIYGIVGNYIKKYTPSKSAGAYAPVIIQGVEQVHHLEKVYEEIDNLTRHFLSEFDEKVTKDYKDKIAAAIEAYQTQKTLEQKAKVARKQQEEARRKSLQQARNRTTDRRVEEAKAQSFSVVCEETLKGQQVNVLKCQEGVNFSYKEAEQLQQSSYQGCIPSTTERLCHDFTKNIQAKILNKMENDLARHFSSMAASISIERIYKARNEALNNIIQANRKKQIADRASTKLKKEQENKKKEQKEEEKNQIQSKAQQEETAQEIKEKGNKGQASKRSSQGNGKVHQEGKGKSNKEREQEGKVTEQEQKEKQAELREASRRAVKAMEISSQAIKKQLEEKSGIGASSNTLSKVDLSNLPHTEVLEAEAKAHFEACRRNPELKKLREYLAITEEKLQKEPHNSALQAIKAQQLAELENNDLHKTNVLLGVQTQALLDQAKQKVSYLALKVAIFGTRHHYSGEVTKEEYKIQLHQAEQEVEKLKSIREEFRNVANAPSSPPIARRGMAAMQGLGDSIVDTGKTFVGSAPGVLLGKELFKLTIKLLEIKDPHSSKQGNILEGRDTKQVNQAIVYIKELLKKFDDAPQSAIKEDPAETESLAEPAYGDLYRRAFDAETYHLEQDRQGCYWLTEILQYAWGEKIIEKLVKYGAKSTQYLNKLTKLTKGLEGTADGAKVAARLKKFIQELKQSSKLSEKTAEGLGRMEALGIGAKPRKMKAVAGTRFRSRKEHKVSVLNELAEMRLQPEYTGPPLDIIGNANIYGSKGIKEGQFVYNIEFITRITEDCEVNMIKVVTSIAEQAKAAGATSVQINGKFVINKKLIKLFSRIERSGGPSLGWEIIGGDVYGSNACLTKKLK
jgi:preprotein translocase subunit SecA